MCDTKGKETAAVKSLPLGCLLIGNSELVFTLLISRDKKRLVQRQVVHFTAGNGVLGAVSWEGYSLLPIQAFLLILCSTVSSSAYTFHSYQS